MITLSDRPFLVVSPEFGNSYTLDVYSLDNAIEVVKSLAYGVTEFRYFDYVFIEIERGLIVQYEASHKIDPYTGDVTFCYEEWYTIETNN